MAAITPARVDDPFRRDHLAIESLTRINGAVWPAHIKAERAARPRVHFANGACKPSRTPKPRQVYWVGKHLEDKVARRIEDACDRNLAFIWQ
jgi:hypothetical protein